MNRSDVNSNWQIWRLTSYVWPLAQPGTEHVEVVHLSVLDSAKWRSSFVTAGLVGEYWAWEILSKNLSKVAIFVPELENLHCRTFAQRVHQSKRVQLNIKSTINLKKLKSMTDHDIPHLEVEQPLAPRFPRLNSQPTLPEKRFSLTFPASISLSWKAPDVSPLSNQLADRISSVRLCAAHILPDNRLARMVLHIWITKTSQVFSMWIYLADKQLRWDTQEKGCQLNKIGVNPTSNGTPKFPFKTSIHNINHFLLDFSSPEHALFV